MIEDDDPMTVAQLIERLSQLPPDLAVWLISDDSYEYGPVEVAVELHECPAARNGPSHAVWISTHYGTKGWGQ